MYGINVYGFMTQKPRPSTMTCTTNTHTRMKAPYNVVSIMSGAPRRRRSMSVGGQVTAMREACSRARGALQLYFRSMDFAAVRPRQDPPSVRTPPRVTNNSQSEPAESPPQQERLRPGLLLKHGIAFTPVLLQRFPLRRFPRFPHCSRIRGRNYRAARRRPRDGYGSPPPCPPALCGWG